MGATVWLVVDGLWGSLVPEYSTVPVRILVSVRDNAIDTRIVLYCTRTSISAFATLGKKGSEGEDQAYGKSERVTGVASGGGVGVWWLPP